MDTDLKTTEKQAFLAAVDTGLWDVMIAAVVSMLAIAPLLSERMGDFWSSAVFVPVWAVLYLAVRAVKKRVVDPRVGVARFGPARKARLTRLTWIMLVANVVAFVAGLVAASNAGPTWTPPVFMGVMILLMFSTAAYFLDIPRFFLYGLLLVVAGAAGEVFWRQGLVSHHGFPVFFGIAAVVIAVTGLLRFAKHLPPRGVESAAAGSLNHD